MILILFLTLNCYFGVDAHSLSSDTPKNEVSDNPFTNCELFKLGGKRGLPFMKEMSLQNGSMLAFYPFTNEETMLTLRLKFDNVSFNVMIDGSMIIWEKCSSSNRRECQEIERESVMHPNYIIPQQWNQIYVIITPKEFSITVQNRMLTTMPMQEYNTTNAKWNVVVKPDSGREPHPNQPDYLYKVQFMCKDSEISENVISIRSHNNKLEGNDISSPSTSGNEGLKGTKLVGIFLALTMAAIIS